MRKIRILYVITKLELGGAQKQLLSLIRGLDPEKFDILLFTSRGGLLLNEAMGIPGIKVKISGFLDRSINPYKDIRAFFELRDFIRTNNIDIVHTHSSKAGIIGRLAAGAPGNKIVLHTVHGWSFNDFQPWWVRALFLRLERCAARFTTRIIVVSKHDLAKGLAMGIGNVNNYSLVRYGINRSEFIPEKDDSLKSELKIGRDDLIVGTISCLKPQKAPEDFIRLAQRICGPRENVKFILIGDGVLRPKLERLINKWGLNGRVILLGWRRDIARLLPALDVFVLTSRWEGMPIAAIEAMSCALPVVATDTGGISELIKDNDNGYLAYPGDIRGMSDKLLVLLKDEGLRRKTAESGRISLGHDYSLPEMVKKTQDLYENLLKLEPKPF